MTEDMGPCVHSTWHSAQCVLQALEIYVGGREGGKKGEGAGRAERESEYTLAPLCPGTFLLTERQGQFLQFSEGLPGAEGSRCPMTLQRSSSGHPGQKS